MAVTKFSSDDNPGDIDVDLSAKDYTRINALGKRPVAIQTEVQYVPIALADINVCDASHGNIYLILH